MLGEVIGRYRLHRILGEGGMGQVYLGEHELIGRTAAVKLLSPRMSGSREALERLFREAVATSQIKHPGIVQVYDYGYVDQCAFLVMEHLEGETLSARLDRQGRLPLRRAMALGRQIAGALQAAHAVGVVHRDLKPANIFIVADPEVAGGERTKILDFGIAKLTEGHSGAIDLTASGALLGTPIFMSPEQCRGEAEISDRSDIYSLGCVLYRMITGRPPFVAETVGRLILDHCTETPPPMSRYLEVEPAVEELVGRMLAKDPGHRPDAALVRQRLEVLEDPTLPPWHGAAPPVAYANEPRPLPGAETTLAAATGVSMAGEPRSRRRRWWGIGAVAIAAVAGVVLASAGGGGEPDRQARSEPTAAAAVTPDAISAAVLDAGVSADAAGVVDAARPAVRVVIRSKPGGAEVRLSRRGDPIGETPFVLERPPGEFPVTVWLRRRGYRPARLVIEGAGEIPAVELERRRSTSSSSPLDTM